jgi:hypothetical protein
MRHPSVLGAIALLFAIAIPAAAQQRDSVPAQVSAPDSTVAVQQSGQPAPPSDLELLARAQLQGETAGAAVRTRGWFAGGFAGGFVGGFIGTGVAYALASSNDVAVPAEQRVAISTQSAAYQQFYQRAFTEKVKSRRKSSALKGGILGAVTMVVVYVSLVGASGY